MGLCRKGENAVVAVARTSRCDIFISTDDQINDSQSIFRKCLGGKFREVQKKLLIESRHVVQESLQSTFCSGSGAAKFFLMPGLLPLQRLALASP